MKSIVFALAVLTIVPANAQYNKANLKLESGTSKEKYHFQNLQLYPIRANEAFVKRHSNMGNYETLKEALDKKKVVITESNGGEVNSLFVENVSKDTVVILSGEVMQGGKQDRMVAQDVILYPKSGKKGLSVFCVEQGRWHPKESGMEFKNYYSISSSKVRKAAAVKKDQQEVWNEVAQATAKNKATSSTGALAALRQSGDFTNELKRYAHFFNKVIGNESDVIGVIAVSGDSVLGGDMFANHQLFEKHYPNLVNSYATEAITTGGAVRVPYEMVQQYLMTVIGDESKQEREVPKKGTLLKDRGKKVHISTF
jgi:hypothetical protein